MKNFRITTLLMATIALLSFSACSDDDSDDNNSGGTKSPTSNTITFDGTTYNLNSGLASDYGATTIGNSNVSSHYNYDFETLDGTITANQDTTGDEFIRSANSTISIYVELFSPDTSSFKTGTFNYIPDSMVTEVSIQGKYWFSASDVQLDNDGVVDGQFDGPNYDVVGGSVIVSGTGPASYTLTYNLQFEGGRNLTGTYNSSFLYNDEK
ncbi:MAG: hypothetical protein RJQ00_02655 [Vicingaceae bacterium]